MRNDAFGSYHPAIVFVFFIAAIVLCVVVNNLYFQVAGIVCAAAYYALTHGRASWKVIVGMVPLFLAVMAINPLFSTQGQTVLFVIPWLGGRPYTLEALTYGACTAAMLVSALLLFFSYNKVMTSEKFTYLFGGLAPALTLVFTMVLRLVPTYQRKASEIAGARSCVGHAVGNGPWREKAADGLAIVSALTTWALEGAIITADSMRSRGYGTGKRSSFARYPFTVRDGVLLAIMAALFLGALGCIFAGFGAVEYYPVITYPQVTAPGLIGFFAFTAFLAIPTIIDLWEAFTWHNSLSKI